MSESLNHSLNRFIKTIDSVRYKTSDWLYDWVLDHSNKRFIQENWFIQGQYNTAVCCLEMYKQWFCFNSICMYYSQHSENVQSTLQYLKCKIIIFKMLKFFRPLMYTHIKQYCILLAVVCEFKHFWINSALVVWNCLFISIRLTKSDQLIWK